MGLLFQLFLIFSFTTPTLSQHYIIAPNISLCHENTTCFTLNEIAAQKDKLYNGTSLTLVFQPGEHALTRLLNISHFINVLIIGQNASVICLHSSGWIELSNIYNLSIKYLTFTELGMTKTAGFPSKYLSITSIHSQFCLNSCIFTDLGSRQSAGGILELVNSVKVVIENVMFCGNNVTSLSITGHGTVSMDNSLFIGNRGNFKGAATIRSGKPKVTINNSIFTRNHAKVRGGAISIESGKVWIFHSNFSGNSGTGGGGISVYSPRAFLSVTNTSFIGNTARFGGGIIVFSGSASNISNCYFADNRAEEGGGVYVGSGIASIYHSSMIDNSAQAGGGISVLLGFVSVFNTKLTSNSAEVTGGAIASHFGNVSIVDSALVDNVACRYGGAITSFQSSTLVINGSSIINSTAGLPDTGFLYIDRSTLTFFENNTISNNNGTIFAFSSRVHFNGLTILENNFAESGGSIQAEQSLIYFNNMLVIANNTARLGGGMFLRESSLFVNSPFRMTHNTAANGGAIYVYQSTIEFNNASHGTRIGSNYASNSGGGIYAVASILKLTQSFVELYSNKAERNGGGLYLEQSSRLYIQKVDPEYTSIKVRLTLSTNVALLGGGIYVDDSTASGGACRSQATEVLGECFVQTIKLYSQASGSTVNIIATNNTAQHSGGAIYGGLLDRCTVNPSSEAFAKHFTVSGLEYIKMAFELPADNHSISSDPLQVRLCADSANESSVLVRKGHLFHRYIRAIDQFGNTVGATIRSSVFTTSGIGRLKAGQVEQRVGNECTPMEYNVFAADSSAQVELYAKGPCNNLGISKLVLNVTFLPCTCALGFHPSPSTIDCSCECDPNLQAARCFPEEETFVLNIDKGLWVGVTSLDCNQTGYLVHNCPFDYCVDKQVNISLNSSQQIDRQCAYNRTGVLCGECEDGLSLVLASSKCKECSNISLLLLIPFALAGIALVTFILVLNMTIGIGTIYGLIFYTNVLAANKAIFLPFMTPNFLTVFVSWVNLDLGIEICFYNGMNSQAKVLLQLVFPLYLFLLILVIIFLSRYVNSFAKLLSNRNPVAALCTLLILSYSKLLRLIIAALQFTYLNCPDSAFDIVWLYDANIQYYALNNTPRFVAAAVILTGCVLFTTLLFFGQWFPICSNWRVMKWTKNTKYIGFMDAFHAPFTPKHRYWVGLLLFALIAHNLAASMAPDSSVPILSAGCLGVGLIFYKTLLKRVYKSKLNDVLENLFLINISILAYGTYYLRQKRTEAQLPLAYVSMAIAFILFVVITCYHLYRYVLKKTNVWNKQVQPLHQGRMWLSFRRNQDYHKLAEIGDNSDTETPGVLDMIGYEQGPREVNDQDKYITPPIIRPATRPDQLREPDLDILAPITEEDYTQVIPVAQAENRPRPFVTSTIVEINGM